MILPPVLLFCNSAFGFTGRDIMVVIFYIIIAKCSYKVRIVCFICIQIKTAASLSAFFHATGNKVFKKCFLVCADYVR